MHTYHISNVQVVHSRISSVRDLKNITVHNKFALTALFLVRSQLELALIIWHPLYNLHVKLIEWIIQSRILKFLSLVFDGVYTLLGDALMALYHKDLIMIR